MDNIKVNFGSDAFQYQEAVHLAIGAHNYIKQSKDSRFLEGHAKGQRFAFLLMARTIKGYSTQAKHVNCMKRVASRTVAA